MRRLTGLGLVLILIGACGATSREPLAQGSAPRGGILYAQSACVGCHGLDAEGTSAGPALIDTPLTLHDYTSVMRRGTPGMPQYPEEQISDRDLQDMYAWFLNPVPLPTPKLHPFPTPGPTLTQTVAQPVVWVDAQCGVCHGANAEGASARGLSAEELTFDEFQQTVRDGAEGMPSYDAGRVSAADMRAMYDWLMALP
ncbi:MAG: cytochrome c [Anaerolineae bacterium]|jgi:mono/diheme cytochrome c family protein